MINIKLVVVLLLLGLGACIQTSNTILLDSDNFETKEERVEILMKEIKPFSSFDNAEFELFNVNGFSNNKATIPGASSWDYKFVVRVNPSDIDNWTDGMTIAEIEDYDDGWTKKIIQKREGDWKTESEPELYKRNGENVTVMGYRTEGIIFKQVVNL